MLKVAPNICNTKHTTTSDHDDRSNLSRGLCIALAAVVCAVVPPVIASRPTCRRIRVLNIHRVGTVDPEARFRTDIPRWAYQDKIPVAGLRNHTDCAASMPFFNNTRNVHRLPHACMMHGCTHCRTRCVIRP